MTKMYLKEFKAQEGYQYIRNHNLICTLLNKMWCFSFEYIFHPRYRLYKPTPWQCIYDELQAEGMDLPDYSSFLSLKFGNIAAMVSDIYYTSKKEKKLNSPLPILIVLGGINKFYNRKGK